MSTILSVILISILAVGIFVLGLSLTLIIKGHNIKSEIGENENMKKLGIKCAAQQMREEERAFMGKVSCDVPIECTSGCSSCIDKTPDK